jgi:hypothetical protein
VIAHHLVVWISGLAAGMLAATVAAIATRVQVLPDVIDVSIIPTTAGLGSLAFAFFGAVRRFDPDRLARVALFGTLLGGAGATVFLLLALLLAVLS